MMFYFLFLELGVHFYREHIEGHGGDLEILYLRVQGDSSDCSALVPFGIALAWMYPPHGTISFLRGPVANNHFFDILSLAVF